MEPPGPPPPPPPDVPAPPCSTTGCTCPGCGFIVPAASGPGGPGNCEDDPTAYCVICPRRGDRPERVVCKFHDPEKMYKWVENQLKLCGCDGGGGCTCADFALYACTKKGNCASTGNNACDFNACFDCAMAKRQRCINGCAAWYAAVEISILAFCEAACVGLLLTAIGYALCLLACHALFWHAIHLHIEACYKNCDTVYEIELNDCVWCYQNCK